MYMYEYMRVNSSSIVSSRERYEGMYRKNPQILQKQDEHWSTDEHVPVETYLGCSCF